MDSALSKVQWNPARLAHFDLAERTWTFLMLGGASLILLVVCSCLSIPSVILQDNVRMLLQQAIAITFVFVLLFSYPHFIWSYRFAYQQGLAFILSHGWQLIVYPMVLVALLVLCAGSWNLPLTAVPPLLGVDKAFQQIGVNMYWSKYDGCGQLLFATMLIAQTILSGHHYCMQAFGVALACGEKSGYRLEIKQKKILLLNLYALWMMNMFSGYTFFSKLNTGSFAYHPTKFPQALCWASYAAFAGSLIAVFVAVIVPALRQQKKFPPLLAVVPIVSIWAWLQPFSQPFGFQATIAPIAHGAQYLHFAYKVEANGFDSRSGKSLRLRAIHLVGFAVVTVLLGYLCFRYIPGILDNAKLLGNVAPNFFLLAAFIFISIHHYIVDSVVWKHDSKARKLLREVV